MAYSLSIGLSTASDSSGANTSTVNWSISVYADYNTTGYYLGYPSYGQVTVNGTQVWTINGAHTDTAPNAWTVIASGTTGAIAHNTNGTYTVSASGDFHADGTYGTGQLYASSSLVLTDFDRRPATPTISSVTRTVQSVAIVLNAVSSPAGTPTYYVSYSKDNGAASTPQTQTTAGTPSTFTFPGLVQGSSYVFTAYAGNADTTNGTYSAVATSSAIVIPTVPGTPANITVGAPAGRAVTVTAGNATTGGAAITGYFVQTSTDNKVTWSTAIPMVPAPTSQSISLTGLTGGATYWFRVYAANEMGNGLPYTSTTSTFVPAGGKRFQAIASPVTAASGNGTTVTYTVANTLTAGKIVTITGLNTTTGASLNLTGVTVAASPAPTATQFSVTNSTVGTSVATQSGVVSSSVNVSTASIYRSGQWVGLSTTKKWVITGGVGAWVDFT